MSNIEDRARNAAIVQAWRDGARYIDLASEWGISPERIRQIIHRSSDWNLPGGEEWKRLPIRLVRLLKQEGFHNLDEAQKLDEDRLAIRHGIGRIDAKLIKRWPL